MVIQFCIEQIPAFKGQVVFSPRKRIGYFGIVGNLLRNDVLVFRIALAGPFQKIFFHKTAVKLPAEFIGVTENILIPGSNRKVSKQKRNIGNSVAVNTTFALTFIFGVINDVLICSVE